MTDLATRRERVILELEDLFSGKMNRAAIATAALKRELHGLSGQAVVSSRSAKTVAKDLDDVDQSGRRSADSINQLTGRLRVLGDLLAILGPTVSSLGAVGLQGLMGLANQLGVAALAGVSVVAAFQGVGDALEAVNKAALEPTADNIAEAADQMERLSPAARDAVNAMQGLRPVLRYIRDAGAEGLFPGFVDALESMESRAPAVARIVSSLNAEVGSLLSTGAASLAGDEWDEFFDFLATDARDTLADLGATVGNLSRGFSELWMTFDPLTDDFNDWAREGSESFAEWADALSQTDGYAEFVAFVRESGPQVADALTSIADAALQIIEASAPISGPVLAGMEALADVVGAIADSDMGTPILAAAAALAIYNRTLAATAAVSARASAGMSGGMLGMLGMTAGGKGLSQASTSMRAARKDVEMLAATWATAGARTAREQERMAAASKSLGSNLAASARAAAPAAAAVAGLAVASTGAADGIGLANTASFALMGSMMGPLGTAAGAAVGAFLDVKAGADQTRAAIEAMDLAIASGDADAMRARVDALRAHQADMDQVSGAFGGKLSVLNATGIGQAGVAMDAGKGLWNELSGAADEAEAKMREGEDAIRDAEAAAVRAAYAAAGATDAYTYSLNTNIAMMNAKRDAALAAENAELGYESAVLSAKDALAQNGRATDQSTRAGQANRQALLGMVGAWNNLAESGGATEGQLRKARAELIRTARQMGYSKEEARDLARMLHGIPDVDVDVSLKDRATDGLTSISNRLKQLDGTQSTVYVNMVRRGQRTGVDPFNPYGSADGGFVPKTGLPYADRHLYLLADGEGVTTNRNGETDLFRDVIEGINAGYSRAQVKGMLAGGGFAGASSPGVRMAGIDSSFARETREAARSAKALAKELKATKDDLSDVRQRRKAAGEAATAPFALDLFGTSDIWSAGTGGAVGNAKAMTAQLRERQRLTWQLRRAGLRGRELDTVLSQAETNEDLQGILASGSARELDQVLTQYSKVERKTRNVVGDAAYGAEIRALRKEVGELRRDLKKGRKEDNEKRDRRSREQADRTGAAVGQRVSAAAARGAGHGRR